MKNLRLYTLLALLMTGISASAYDFYSICPTGQKLGYIITSYDPPEVLLESMFDLADYVGGVTIPETVNYNSVDYTVVAIGADAFNKGCFSNDLSGSLVIPNTVRLIGPRAFLGCWFTGSLVIPNSVISIGEWAFHNCKRFSSLTLSESLVEINNNAFDLCENFRGDLVIPESVEYIGFNGFNECGFDGTLYLPPKMTLIESGCFEACYGFSSINISEGVTYIGYCAFEFLHKPTELELPSTVTEIEGGAFRNLFRLTSMTVKASYPPYIWDDTFERVNRDIPVYIPKGTIEEYRNAEYWSEFFNYIEVDFEGVDEQENLITATVYPNPTVDWVCIDGVEATEVQVYNAVGQLMKTVKGTNEVGLNGLVEGVYLLRIMDMDGRSRSVRVVKER